MKITCIYNPTHEAWLSISKNCIYSEDFYYSYVKAFLEYDLPVYLFYLFTELRHTFFSQLQCKGETHMVDVKLR